LGRTITHFCVFGLITLNKQLKLQWRGLVQTENQQRRKFNEICRATDASAYVKKEEKIGSANHEVANGQK